MKLYSYQEQALDAIASDPEHSQLISMPTGTGKTITFLHAAKRLNKNCLIIVHREELLKQTYEKAKLCGFKEEEISLICADKKEELSKLNIAMVQTLSRNLSRYNSDDIEVLIIDEAHHATARSYKDVIEHFKIFEEKKYLIGFTATPLRGDGAALSSIFHSHTFKITLSEATQNGYICPVHGVRVEIKKELSDIQSMQGDYDIQELDRVMNCPSVNEVVTTKCQHLGRVPAILFCTSVAHAQKLAEILNDMGRKAISVSYKTPKQELAKIYDDLKEGKIEFISNAVKLSEGFDFPPIQSVIIARPTRSPVLYKQMIGRGLRKSEGKHDCFVLEFGGNDPKMICWEDIDENCTFQSYSAEQTKNVEESKRFYTSRFKSPNVTVLDVRVSHFKFYECRVRRICKYKNVYYCPHEQGFVLFHPRYLRGNHKLEGYNLWAAMYFWNEPYRTFYQWDDADWLWYRPEGHPGKDLLPQIRFFCEKQCPPEGLAKWYPSEEEPMTGKQKFFLKDYAVGKLSARKAEMLIEDIAIKKMIEMYLASHQFVIGGNWQGEIDWENKRK